MEQQIRAFDIPELVWKIFLNLSAHDILSLCKTSKQLAVYCRDPLLWAAKAEQDFNFPRRLFSRISSHTPYKEYLYIRNYKPDPGGYLSHFADIGDLEFVSWLVRQRGITANNIHNSLVISAQNGHLPIVQLLAQIDPHPGKLFRAIEAASYQGHLPVVQWLIKFVEARKARGIYNEALRIGFISAVNANQINVAEWLIDKITVNKEGILNHSLRVAAVDDDLPMVQWLVEHGATDIQTALNFGLHAGQTPVVKYLRSLLQ